MAYNDLINELGTNFIEYAAAVNGDRAIPDATSGLKPVARRILWGAFDGGYTSNKEHAKCARIVGDVMGKWHPHGDSSIYGALVRLSQPWVMRYPLIDFHGNMGNIGGDGPAAYRYTNARLAKIAEDGMLFNLKKKNVDFIPNYDENDYEPITLPTIFPNLLCNPNTGIGVAMACNWASHNLTEVAQAIYDYMDGKEPMLPGPDFPTGGLIINKNDIPNIMATGRGSVKIRGRYNIEKQNIVFYEIPYGTTTEGIMTEIGEICDAKEIEGISNIRDESNKKGLRIVIQCDKNYNPEEIVKKLFTKTKLQTSFSYNQVALVDKTPTELNLKQCIEIYIKHNISCLIKEINFDLTKAKARLEIVEGLLIALEDIDNIIAKIKASENAAAAKQKLITDYKMTENQAKAVLDMKLAKLAKLEKVEVQNEKNSLLENIKQLNELLLNEDKQKNVIRERLTNLVKKYGDKRRTELAQIEVPKEEKETETIIPEDCVVIMTQTGDIKRIPKASFKVQRRGGKGIKTVDDVVMDAISTNTVDNLMIFTNKGKMFKLLVDNVPVGTNSTKGANISNLINMEPDEKAIAISSFNKKTTAQYVVFITKKGLIKKTQLDEYKNVKKTTGIQATKIADGDSIANVLFINEEQLLLVTKKGMAIRFESKLINAIGRVAMGVKGITLNEEDEVIIGLPIANDKDCIGIIAATGYGKKVLASEFPIQGRGGKGVFILKTTPATGDLTGARTLTQDDNVLLISKTSSICVSSEEFPLSSRIAIGNIMTSNRNITSMIKI